MPKVFILGADDPEMQTISYCLRKKELEYRYAAVDGQRCYPSTAYRADSTVTPEGRIEMLAGDYDQFVFVECRPWNIPLKEKHIRLLALDHHEEGDPGYDLGPENFWEASSLGQVIRSLRIMGHPLAITHSMRVLAAMDHCRQAAMRGECPGISPYEVITRRIQEIAAAKGVTSEAVQTRIDKYIATFRNCQAKRFGSGEVIDYTEHHLGSGYSLDLLSAQTALDIEGLSALLRHNDAPGESSERISISGHVTPDMVTYFLQHYAPEKSLHRTFGVPRRGYAGGFLRP